MLSLGCKCKDTRDKYLVSRAFIRCILLPSLDRIPFTYAYQWASGGVSQSHIPCQALKSAGTLAKKSRGDRQVGHKFSENGSFFAALKMCQVILTEIPM